MKHFRLCSLECLWLSPLACFSYAGILWKQLPQIILFSISKSKHQHIFVNVVPFCVKRQNRKKRWTHHHDSPHGWVAINKMWIIYGRVSIKKNWNIIRFYFSFVPSWQPNRLLSIFPPPNISDWNICLFFLGSWNTSHHFAWKVTILIYQVITPRPVVNNFGGAIYRRHRKKKQAFLNSYNNVVAK